MTARSLQMQVNHKLNFPFCSSTANGPDGQANVSQTHNTSNNNTEKYISDKEATEFVMNILKIEEDRAKKIVDNIRRPNGTITQQVLNSLLERINKA